MDDNIVDGGEYYTEDRLILTNVDRIPELLTILGEEKIPHYDTNLRINQNFIYFVQRHHYNILKMYSIKIEKLPRYFNWRIVEKNHREELILEFPWAELARAYVTQDEFHPLREAVESGEILGIENLIPYLSESTE